METRSKQIREAQREMEKAKSFENQKMQLRLFQDDNNLWRCDEKIGNADVSKPVKHPYILDKKHYLTKLIDVWGTKNIKFNSCRGMDLTGQKYIIRRFKSKPYSYPQHGNFLKKGFQKEMIFWMQAQTTLDHSMARIFITMIQMIRIKLDLELLSVSNCTIYLDLVPDCSESFIIEI